MSLNQKITPNQKGCQVASIRFIDRKKREIVELSEAEANNPVLIDQNNLIPLPDHPYYVETKDGQFTEIKGKDLYRTIGDTTGKILNLDDYAVKKAVQVENTKTGAFLKSALSEAVFLGLNKNQALPDDPLSRAIEIEKQKQFGGAETAGGVVGSIAPLLAGGIGRQLLKAGIKKGLKKGVGYRAGQALHKAGSLPSAQVFTQSSKVGQKLAKSVGGGKIAQNLAKAGGSGLTFAGIEACLLYTSPSPRD